MTMHQQHTSRRTPRGGFTLMELLVSVAVLSLLILAFGQIVSKSQQVVTATQGNMRATRVAMAIGQTIRRDLRRATSNGVMCITQKSSATSGPVLIVTTAGPCQSKTGNASSNAGISCYGLMTATGKAGYGTSEADNKILARQGWILDDSSSGDDVWADTLGNIQTSPPATLLSLIGSVRNKLTGGNIPYPITNLTDIGTSWQILAPECSSLAIMWTDGAKHPGGELRWYGVDSIATDNSKNTNNKAVWRDPSRDGATFPSDEDGQAEFMTHVESEDSGAYRAVWTRYNSSQWPKAVKISFRIYDKSLQRSGDTESDVAAESTEGLNNRYEIICNMGR